MFGSQGDVMPDPTRRPTNSPPGKLPGCRARTRHALRHRQPRAGGRTRGLEIFRAMIAASCRRRRSWRRSTSCGSRPTPAGSSSRAGPDSPHYNPMGSCTVAGSRPCSTRPSAAPSRRCCGGQGLHDRRAQDQHRPPADPTRSRSSAPRAGSSTPAAGWRPPTRGSRAPTASCTLTARRRASSSTRPEILTP
jgi:hypothetical protein